MLFVSLKHAARPIEAGANHLVAPGAEVTLIIKGASSLVNTE